MASATVLPKELRLAAPPTMPQARSYMFKQQAAQAEAIPGDTFHINLPRLQRSYLTKDSYLKFTVEATMKTISATSGTDAATTPQFEAYWDTIGALGLIHKIEIYDYLGSTLLESITGVAELVTLLTDLGVAGEELPKHFSVTQGTTDQKYLTMSSTDSAPRGTFTAPFSVIGQPIFKQASNTQVIYSRDYAFPLFSFLGLLSEKFVPLHNGFTIAITLNQLAVATGLVRTHGADSTAVLPSGTTSMVASADTNFNLKLRDINFCSQVLELGPEAESLLMSSAGPNPLIIPTKSYRNFIGHVPAGSATYRLDLNLNVASLTNIMWIMRNSNYNLPHFRSLSHRLRNFLQSWYFQYGSSMLPQTSGIQCRSKDLGGDRALQSEDARLAGEPIVGGNVNKKWGCYDHTEAYYELIKARHKFNTPQHPGLISIDSFIHDTDTSTGANNLYAESVLSPLNAYPVGQFAAGLDLELISGRSNELISGMNTNGMNTSINATFDPKHNNDVVNARIDCWCEYDSFINIAPGIATTVSF